MVSIVIQAGGKSNRMGQNKALMPFLGEPLLARVARRLEGLGDELWVASNWGEELAALQLPVKADCFPDLGALGGLLTALSEARFSLVVVVACDMPFLHSGLLRAQIELLETDSVDVVIPRLPEGYEPFHAVYRKETCLPAVERAIRAGQRRMVSWLDTVRVRELLAEEMRVVDAELRSFMNINDPVEFAAAEELARRLKKE
jgi:molybdenum cofactor guanylyltransferase